MEHDEEQSHVHEIYLVEVVYVCVCREIWVGVYESYRIKNQHEDWVLLYDALVSDDVFVFNFSLWGMWNTQA